MASAYDLDLTKVTDNLTSTLGGGLAGRILAAISQTPGGQSGDVTLLSDYVPGQSVPSGTQIVVMSENTSGNVGTLPDVPAVIFSGKAGVQVVLDGGSQQIVQFGNANDVVTLSDTAANKFVDLGSGNDRFVGNTLSNSVVAGSGIKTIDLGAGNDAIDLTGSSGVTDGGTGFDTAFINGKSSDFSIKVVGGSVQISNQVSGGVVSLANTEYVKFSDGTVVINVQNEVDAAIARIYEVALNRSADASGIKFWIDHTDVTGATTIALANDFLHSQEFTDMNGKSVDQMTNADFLNVVYHNAFDRAPDAGGFQYWVDQLAHGMSRGEVVARFAFEAEAQAKFDGHVNVISTIQ